MTDAEAALSDDDGDLTEIPFSPNCEDPKGWHFEGDPPAKFDDPLDTCTVIEFCEDLCQQLRNGALEEISFWFGCMPDIVI